MPKEPEPTRTIPASTGVRMDCSVGNGFDLGITRPINASLAQGNVSGHAYEYKNVGVALRCHIGVRRAGLAHIQRRGAGNSGLVGADLREVVLPIFGKEQGVVLQLGYFACDAQIQQHGTGSRDLLIRR